MPFHRSPGSFKRSQMADYLPPMAPVSTNALTWLGESGYALARYRAFLKHARKPSSHDQQSWSSETSLLPACRRPSRVGMRRGLDCSHTFEGTPSRPTSVGAITRDARRGPEQ